MLTESHYTQFIQKNRDYLIQTREVLHRLLSEVDNGVADLNGEEATTYLTKQNYQIMAKMRELTMKAIADCITGGLELSKLTFDMDKNL